MLNGAAAELRLTTTSGAELVVETDADDPRVGDPATPDGEHTLEDGRVVVVTDGVITEIRERTEETITEEEVQAMADTIESLTAEVKRLNADVEAARGQVKTPEEQAILDIVSKAGGKEWLDVVAVSTRAATPRVQRESNQAIGVSVVAQELNRIRTNKK